LSEGRDKFKEQSYNLQTTNRRKANWIGHILRRNCLLKDVIEGKIQGRLEVTGRRGRRRKQILDDVKETRVTGNRKIGHTLRRNCILRHVAEGNIEGRIYVTGGRGRRRK